MIIVIETLFDVRLNWSARWQRVDAGCLEVGDLKDVCLISYQFEKQNNEMC